MKNPFEKDDHSGLIIAVAAGALVAGVLTYLFLTDSGHDVIRSVKHKFKDEAKELAADIVSKKSGLKKKTLKKAADHFIK